MNQNDNLVPFANENDEATPLSLLEAALREPLGVNAKTFIMTAIHFLKEGKKLTDVCFDKAEIQSAQCGLKELTS